MEAAQQFFKQALAVVGHISYPRAIRETIGSNVQHQTNKYLNNRLKQNHRGIKQRYYPMYGFGSFDSAARFCSAFDELRNYLRPDSAMREPVTSLAQRQVFLDQLAALKEAIQAVF
jgi:putative transposase